jgi:hypothetical protein
MDAQAIRDLVKENTVKPLHEPRAEAVPAAEPLPRS